MYIKNFNHFLNESLDSNVTELTDAIKNKFVCVIDYRGEDKGSIENGIRYIEPYTIGTNASGNIILRAWMLRGVSRTGRIDPSLVPGWRLYRVDRIFNIETTLDEIEPRKGFNPDGDKKMTEIITTIQL